MQKLSAEPPFRHALEVQEPYGKQPNFQNLDRSDTPASQDALLGGDEEDPRRELVEIPWKAIATKVACMVVCFVVVTVLLDKFAAKAVAKVARKLMKHIGIPGLFFCVFLADGLPQPFTYVPLIFMAVQGDVPKPEVFTVCAGASYVAAVSGYAIGLSLRSISCGDSFFQKLNQDHPQVPLLMHQKGAFGVALAALLPVPLAMATWTAGSFRIDFKRFLLAACCRWPKILVFVLLSTTPSPEPPLQEHTVKAEPQTFGLVQ
mmetsp:Transcript_24814/g.52855  ORF Transcript_24814/g.52855 Transcript_24814/m.52855 type:complete len:261 (-) Transcript_24814:56-838(-)